MPSSSISPPRADRVALVLVQAGALAVVLASLPYKPFDLDRYFVPKELVLHIAAAGAALCCLLPRGRLSLARIDWLLIGYLALSTVSAVFASNHWLSTRALAISLSGAALFWVGRVLRRDGLARPVLWALGLAGAVGAATALLQAYGVTTRVLQPQSVAREERSGIATSWRISAPSSRRRSSTAALPRAARSGHSSPPCSSLSSRPPRSCREVARHGWRYSRRASPWRSSRS